MAMLPAAPFASFSTSAETERLTGTDILARMLYNTHRVRVGVARVSASIQPDQHTGAGDTRCRRQFGAQREAAGDALFG